jgi:hypothetical protein
MSYVGAFVVAVALIVGMALVDMFFHSKSEEWERVMWIALAALAITFAAFLIVPLTGAVVP